MERPMRLKKQSLRDKSLQPCQPDVHKTHGYQLALRFRGSREGAKESTEGALWGSAEANDFLDLGLSCPGCFLLPKLCYQG